MSRFAGKRFGAIAMTALLASGPLALQWGRGTIRFRKVQIRSL